MGCDFFRLPMFVFVSYGLDYVEVRYRHSTVPCRIHKGGGWVPAVYIVRGSPHNVDTMESSHIIQQTTLSWAGMQVVPLQPSLLVDSPRLWVIIYLRACMLLNLHRSSSDESNNVNIRKSYEARCAQIEQMRWWAAPTRRHLGFSALQGAAGLRLLLPDTAKRVGSLIKMLKLMHRVCQ